MSGEKNDLIVKRFLLARLRTFRTSKLLYTRCSFRYSDDPPLDDEVEERLYIRELVATKFQEASSLKSDANSNQANSARSEKPPSRVSAQIDLLASKFRMSRRHGDWKSNLLGHKSDDRVSPSKNKCSPTKELTKEEEPTSRNNHAPDYHQRESSASECIGARGTACRIQMGPSVNIVADRRLTKQNLEDVHISPCPFLPQNTATYTLRHDEKSIDRKANETETSRALKPLSVELDSLQQKKPERLTEATNGSLITPTKSVEDVAHVGNFNPEQTESESHDYGKKKKNRKLGSRNVRDETISNQETIVSDANEKPDMSDEKLKPQNEKQVKIIVSDASDIDERPLEREKERDTADKEMCFSRHENITPHCRASKNRKFYRTIDEHLAINTFGNGQEELHDIANKDCTRRQSPTSDYRNNFQWEIDNSNDLTDLYRPRVDDLNSVLLSNDRKLRHIARATKTFAELLSRPEFAKLKADESGRYKKFYREPFADKNCKPLLNRVSSSEIELKNEDLTVASHLETNVNDAQQTKSSDCPTSNNDRTKNSLESSIYPESDGSEALRIFRSNKTKTAPSSDSSSDKSDIATLFSNLDPALSSTHTQACRHGEKRVVRANQSADTKLRAANVNEFSESRVHWNEHLSNDDVSFARIFQGLKDTSEATDRFVAYILQDEKHSIEKKIRQALNESAIVPATIQKLLNRLSESVRTTCQTETLNILKTILSDVQDRTDQKVTSKVSNDKTQSSQNLPEHGYDSEHSDKLSSDTGKNERNTETANIIEPVETDVKNEPDESIDEESKKDDKKTLSENVIYRFVQANAIKEPILQTQDAEDKASKQISRKSHDLKNSDKYSRDFSEIPGEETAEGARSESESGNKSKGNLYSEAESLRQISDIHSDDDNIGDLQNSKITSVNKERKSKSDHDLTTTDTNQEQHKNKPSNVRDNKNSIRVDEFTDKNSIQTVAINTDISKNTSVKEATAEKEQHSGSVSMQKRISGDKISEASKKQLDSISSKTVDKNPTKKDAGFPLSTKDIELAKNDNNLQQSVIATQTSDCSISSSNSVRNSIAHVSNVKNKKLLLKEVSSRDKQTCFNITEKNNLTENTPLKSDKPKGENGKLLENAESSDDQTNTLSRSQVNQLFVSNSSVSSALLDLDGG